MTLTSNEPEYRNGHERLLAERIWQHRQEAAAHNALEDEGPTTRAQERRLNRALHKVAQRTFTARQGHGAPSALGRRIARYQATGRPLRKIKRNRPWQ